MSHLPWMQIFIGDELAETSHLSAEEYGAHMRLRLHQWQHEELPSDEDRLRRIAGLDREEWARVRDSLAPLFGWQWHHARTDEVRRASEEKREKMSENGKKGGRPRKGKVEPEKADGKQMESKTESKTEAKPEAEFKADGKPMETPSPSPLQSQSASNSPSPVEGFALEKDDLSEGTYTRDGLAQSATQSEASKPVVTQPPASDGEKKKNTQQHVPLRDGRTAPASTPSPGPNSYLAAKNGGAIERGPYSAPKTDDGAKVFLTSKNVPESEWPRLLPSLMRGELYPYDLEPWGTAA